MAINDKDKIPDCIYHIAEMMPKQPQKCSECEWASNCGFEAANNWRINDETDTTG